MAMLKNYKTKYMEVLDKTKLDRRYNNNDHNNDNILMMMLIIVMLFIVY